MKHTALITILFVLTMQFLCLAQVEGAEEETEPEAETSAHPVYLVYGIAYQNVEFLMGALREVQDALLEEGIPSFITAKEAFAPIEDNARIMREEILQYLAEHPEHGQVDIIAHSKGGLEARYMIHHLGMAEYVSSLTTLSTPHRGSPAAEFIVEDAGEGGRLIATVVANAVGTLLGDSDPDSLRAIHQLTPEFMESFNKATPDAPGIYYSSYAAHIGEKYPSLLYRTTGEAVYEEAGPNDGFVPVESAKWGEYGGLINDLYGHEGLSHSDIIGGNPFTRNIEFDHVRFFLDIVERVRRERVDEGGAE